MNPGKSTMGVGIAALGYFATVFAVGFMLGAIRVTLVVPWLGVRWAELAELPLMVLASWLAARYWVARFRIVGRGEATAMGLVALGLLVCAELGLVLAQGRGVTEYVSGRDPVSGSAYLLSLMLFAAMPLLVRTAQPRRS